MIHIVTHSCKVYMDHVDEKKSNLRALLRKMLRKVYEIDNDVMWSTRINHKQLVDGSDIFRLVKTQRKHALGTCKEYIKTEVKINCRLETRMTEIKRKAEKAMDG